MYQETTMQVSRYDWTLYHQAIELAKARHFRDPNQVEFDAACNAAYARLIQSSDTETVKIYRFVEATQ